MSSTFGGAEHLGIFEGLVLPFGDREDRHLVVLAEVEGGGADQIADVFDHQDVGCFQVEVLHAVADHMGVQMTAGTSVDLLRPARRWRRCARHRCGLLVPFEDGEGPSRPLQVGQGALEKGGLPRAGGTDEVEDEEALGGEKGPVVRRPGGCSWRACPLRCAGSAPLRARGHVHRHEGGRGHGDGVRQAQPQSVHMVSRPPFR